jgi:hypothetical protein
MSASGRTGKTRSPSRVLEALNGTCRMTESAFRVLRSTSTLCVLRLRFWPAASGIGISRASLKRGGTPSRRSIAPSGRGSFSQAFAVARGCVTAGSGTSRVNTTAGLRTRLVAVRTSSSRGFICAARRTLLQHRCQGSRRCPSWPPAISEYRLTVRNSSANTRSAL